MAALLNAARPHGRGLSTAFRLVRPETMRSSTSVSKDSGSASFNFPAHRLTLIVLSKRGRIPGIAYRRCQNRQLNQWPISLSVSPGSPIAISNSMAPASLEIDLISIVYKTRTKSAESTGPERKGHQREIPNVRYALRGQQLSTQNRANPGLLPRANRRGRAFRVGGLAER